MTTKQCPVCAGAGYKDGSSCHRCYGTGTVAVQDAAQDDPGGSGPPPDGSGGSTGN